jgi:hypothetical protein
LRWALMAWLRHFHVAPRADLAEVATIWRAVSQAWRPATARWATIAA